MSIQEKISILPDDVKKLYQLSESDLSNIRTYNLHREGNLMNWIQSFLDYKEFQALIGNPMTREERRAFNSIILQCTETLLHLIINDVCMGLVNIKMFQCIGSACFVASFILPMAYDFDGSVGDILNYVCSVSKGVCSKQTVNRIMSDILIRTDWQLCKADMGIDRVHWIDEPEESKEEKVEMIRNMRYMIQEARQQGVDSQWSGSRCSSRSYSGKRRKSSSRRRRSKSRYGSKKLWHVANGTG